VFLWPFQVSGFSRGGVGGGVEATLSITEGTEKNAKSIKRGKCLPHPAAILVTIPSGGRTAEKLRFFHVEEFEVHKR